MALAFWISLAGGAVFYSTVIPDIIDLLANGTVVRRLVPYDGWTALPPLSLTHYSPGPNVDFYVFGVGLSVVGSMIIAGLLVVLVLRLREPGMSLSQIPLLAGSTLLASSATIVTFVPMLVGIVLLGLERHLAGFPRILADHPLLWQNFFWLFAQSLNYILFLLAAGVISTIVPVFCRRQIVGYRLVVLAEIGLTVLSFMGWLVHMTTTGIPGPWLDISAAAAALTAIPSGVLVLAWIATIRAGRPTFSPPLLFALGSLGFLVLGGVSGVLITMVPLNQQLHNSYFTVGYLHVILFGAVVFPAFAGLYYWVPRVIGRALNYWLGVLNFALLGVGTLLTFVPMYILGLLGMPRYVYTYPVGQGWDPYNLAASVGGFVLGLAALAFLADIAWSLRYGPAAEHDRWRVETLEWILLSRPVRASARVLPTPGSDLPGRATTDPATPDVPALQTLDRYSPRLDSGPSYLPLTLSIGLSAVVAGALFSLLPLGLVGVAITVLAAIAWPFGEKG
jgi:cytochrome c oxidase subunit I+III